MQPSKPVRKATDKAFMSGANVKGTEKVNEPSKKMAAPVDKSTYTRKGSGVSSTNLPDYKTPDK